MALSTENIRNIALLGHGGSGKTSLLESMLFASGNISRLGKTTDGNTTSDFDDEEKVRGFSLSLATANFMWKDAKINVLDTPGYLDFAGEVLEGVRVADAAVITVDAKAGLEVGAELGWGYAQKAGIARAFFINKFDDPDADFKRVFDELKEQFGTSVCPVLVPVRKGNDFVLINLIDMSAITYDAKGNVSAVAMTGEYEDLAAEYKEAFNEAVSAADEELMMKYLDGEELEAEELINALKAGIASGDVAPVYCGAAVKMWGVTALMDAIAASFPNPLARENEVSADDDEIAIEENGDVALFVFKTAVDKYGKQSYFKVMNGTLTKDMALKNLTTDGSEKFAHIYTLCGAKQTEVDALCCGDIGMVSKLANTNTNDTLRASGDVAYKPISFPKPYLERAIDAAKGDEDKISTAIARLLDEDKTLHYENNAETKQMVIAGLGDIHLDVIVSRMKNRSNVSVVLTEPRIAYRETIKGKSDVQGKHKKQTGGSGQYGDVHIRFAHGDEPGLTFTVSVVGGTVPKNFNPAVEKGLLEAMEHGILAGYPMVNLAADLYDGSYHPVDSSEIAFKLAARLAYKAGMPLANPILLEPIGSLKVSVPDAYVGDIIGDLTKRRGRMNGMNPTEGKAGYTTIEGDVPKAEMADYVVMLRATTQGRGYFDFDVTNYEEVPASVAQKVIAEHKIEVEE